MNGYTFEQSRSTRSRDSNQRLREIRAASQTDSRRIRVLQRAAEKAAQMTAEECSRFRAQLRSGQQPNPAGPRE